ncbi:MAG: Ig-like domain-containing protein, partial [Gemmatimonadota bacterium]|nr:Ig-like domain-containing protein [Gemmatimonadota bacterium]
MLLLLLLLQAPAAQAAQNPGPIARIVVEPSGRIVTAGDTVRLRGTALDSTGAPIPGARVYFFSAPSSRFEGRVDTTGLLRAGSPGTLPMTVRALAADGSARTEQFDLQIVAGPAARITAAPARLRLVPGQSVPVEVEAFSQAGDRRRGTMTWTSSKAKVASVTPAGVISGVAAGSATITVRMDAAEQQIPVEVVGTPIASVEVKASAVTARQGDVIRFSATALDRAGKPIAGLMPVWSFSGGPGTIDADGAFVGYGAGRYTVTAAVGSRAASTTVSLDWRDVRRPATVVGRLARSLFTTEEVWLHPNGKIAYLGTGSGGDRMYAIDISDPSRPVVTDSLMANARRINDIMTTPDGKYLVHTREGAADRKNGIVIASLEDPAHPKLLAEFTDGVTGGVHSAFVYRQEKYGTHIYLTNDGTSYLHIVDIG